MGLVLVAVEEVEVLTFVASIRYCRVSFWRKWSWCRSFWSHGSGWSGCRWTDRCSWTSNFQNVGELSIVVSRGENTFLAVFFQLGDTIALEGGESQFVVCDGGGHGVVDVFLVCCCLLLGVFFVPKSLLVCHESGLSFKHDSADI